MLSASSGVLGLSSEVIDRSATRYPRALARWLDDNAQVHVSCLDNALSQFNQIMGAMQSALTGETVGLPAQVDDDVVTKLEKELKR